MFNAYMFAFVAMMFWGIAPILGKLGLGGLQPLAALTIRSLVVSMLLVITVTVKGQWEFVAGVTAKDAVYIAFEGVCAALLGQLAYYYALKFGEVSKVSPLVSAFPLVALVFAVIILGEKITAAKLMAAVLIVTGIVLLKY